MEQAHPHEKRDRVAAHLRPLVECAGGIGYGARAFLHATKPAA
jgi:hypothetical protein